jgi:hypothetical protein
MRQSFVPDAGPGVVIEVSGAHEAPKPTPAEEKAGNGASLNIHLRRLKI